MEVPEDGQDSDVDGSHIPGVVLGDVAGREYDSDGGGRRDVAFLERVSDAGGDGEEKTKYVASRKHNVALITYYCFFIP